MMSVDAELAVLEETIRLKALGNALVALAHFADSKKKAMDDCQVEQIGEMVVELAKQIEGKLGEL